MIWRSGNLSFRHVLPSDGFFVADCFTDWPTPRTMQCVLNDTAEWASASLQALRPLRPGSLQQETFIVMDGSVQVGVVRYEQRPERECYVTHHLVHPGQRGRGYHSRIVPAACAYAFDILATPICRYEVLQSAIAVFKVGEKFGYLEDGQDITAHGNPVVRMYYMREQWVHHPGRVSAEMV